jgi:hypothetical protein
MSAARKRTAQAMTKRRVQRLAWVGVALCVVALALGVTERFVESRQRPGDGITKLNYQRIHEGMPLREVEGILGKRPGNYQSGRPLLALDVYGGGVLMNGGVMVEWWGDRGIVQVGLDANQRVLWTRFVEVYLLAVPKPDPLDRLRSLFGR